VNYSEALAALRTLVSADDEPTLDDLEIAQVLKFGERCDLAGNSPLNLSTVSGYAEDTDYVVGDVVVDGDTGRYWLALCSGTSAAAVFPDLDAEPLTSVRVEDGSVLWVDNGTQWRPTYDLNVAASWGWRVKAGKVSAKYQFQTDGQVFSRQQWFAHCMELSKAFERKAPTTVTLVEV
jgi:hypothetical protein